MITGVVTLDDRYAHADAVTQKINNVEQEQKDLRVQMKDAIVNLRQKQLEDYVFTYTFKVQMQQATPLDKALLYRYQQELNSLTTTPQSQLMPRSQSHTHTHTHFTVDLFLCFG